MLKNLTCPVEADLLVLLPQTTLKSFDDIKDKTCAICMKDYEIKDKLLSTPCNHDYHLTCIRDWFRVKDTCPICKFKIVKENIAMTARV